MILQTYGDAVVRARSVSGDPDIDTGAGVPGRRYRIFEKVGAREGDDPQGRAYWTLDEEGSTGGSHWCYPEDAEEVPAPELPSAESLLSAVSWALISIDHDGIQAEGTDKMGDAEVAVTCRTDEGLRFSFTVTIGEVVEDGY